MAAVGQLAEVEVLDSQVQQMLKQVEHRAVDVTPVWLEFHQYMRVMVDNMFQKNRLGGTWRGETWSYFAPQYTRKTDGVTVPAWGGVSKLRGKGMVLGRMRPSGARVEQGNAILQDLNNLRGKATATVFVRSAAMLRFGTSAVDYAATQNERRKFLFFQLPQDAEELTRILARHFLRKGEAAA